MSGEKAPKKGLFSLCDQEVKRGVKNRKKGKKCGKKGGNLRSRGKGALTLGREETCDARLLTGKLLKGGERMIWGLFVVGETGVAP